MYIEHHSTKRLLQEYINECCWPGHRPGKNLADAIKALRPGEAVQVRHVATEPGPYPGGVEPDGSIYAIIQRTGGKSIRVVRKFLGR